jgi:hypothetical protein
MKKYYESQVHALRLAEGRLQLLLNAELPNSDHPSATRYVLDIVKRALDDAPSSPSVSA